MPNNKTILIIDDDTNLSLTLYGALANDYRVITAKTAHSGFEKLKKFNINLIILDLNLPDVHGLKLLKQIRRFGHNLPILILSAEDSLTTKVELLNSGANDYLTKPFSLMEFRARINALLRLELSFPKNSILISKNIMLDPKRRQFVRDGKTIDLRQKEFSILECLIRNTGKIVSRSLLIENVWPNKTTLKTNAIDVHINSLRGKIDLGFNYPLIKTVHGMGYLFDIKKPKVGA